MERGKKRGGTLKEGGKLVETQIIIDSFHGPNLYSAHNSSPVGDRGHSEIALLTRLQNGTHVVDEHPPFPIFNIWP